MTNKKQLLRIAFIVIAFGIYFVNERFIQPNTQSTAPLDNTLLREAIANQKSDVQVTGSGEVIKVLPDDTHGSQHQRFLIRLDTGETLLIAHNIDLAPRVAGLIEGTPINFNGEFEWNEKGGVIHWTHKDPRNKHVHGWLEYHGTKYW